MKEIVNQLNSLAYYKDSIVRHLNEEEKNYIADKGKIKEIEKGEVIYSEKQRISGFYLVIEGIIKIYETGNDGKEQIIYFAKEGDIIAYRSVLSEELACTSAKTLEKSKLIYIPAPTLFYLIENNGKFSLDLLKLIAKELKQANSYITDIAQKTVRERLAEVLLKLHDTFGEDEEGFLKILLTREELANIVGTATESVIRLLSEFKSDQLIYLKSRKIKLTNYLKLNKIAKYSL